MKKRRFIKFNDLSDAFLKEHALLKNYRMELLLNEREKSYYEIIEETEKCYILNSANSMFAIEILKKYENKDFEVYNDLIKANNVILDLTKNNSIYKSDDKNNCDYSLEIKINTNNNSFYLYFHEAGKEILHIENSELCFLDSIISVIESRSGYIIKNERRKV